jgi:hypothetical protein
LIFRSAGTVDAKRLVKFHLLMSGRERTYMNAAHIYFIVRYPLLRKEESCQVSLSVLKFQHMLRRKVSNLFPSVCFWRETWTYVFERILNYVSNGRDFP